MPKINFSQSNMEVGSKSPSGGDQINFEGSDANLFSILMDKASNQKSREHAALNDIVKTESDENLTKLLTNNPKEISSRLNLISDQSVVDKNLNNLAGKIDIKNLLSEENLDLPRQELDKKLNLNLNKLNKLKYNLESAFPNHDRDIISHEKILNSLQSANGPAKINPQIEEKVDLLNKKIIDQAKLSKGIELYDTLDSVGKNNLISSKSELNLKTDLNLDNNSGNLHLISSDAGLENKIENRLINKMVTNTNSLDFSRLDLNSVSESDILNQITNHLDKMKLSSTKELNVIVRHNELGQFQINANEVNSANDPKLNLEILTNSKDVKTFFKLNEASLNTLLTDKGFNLNGIKISSSSNESFSKDLSFSSDEKGFSGQQSRREGQNQDSQRRANLWKQYQERLGA